MQQTPAITLNMLSLYYCVDIMAFWRETRPLRGVAASPHVIIDGQGAATPRAIFKFGILWSTLDSYYSILMHRIAPFPSNSEGSPRVPIRFPPSSLHTACMALSFWLCDNNSIMNGSYEALFFIKPHSFFPKASSYLRAKQKKRLV